MDVLATLKVNDLDGNLLHKVHQVFSDDIGCTLDEFIAHYGEHIEEYLLNKVEYDESYYGKVVLRFHYLALSDEFEDDNGVYDNDGSVTEYEDGAVMYDMALTNERVTIRFGTIREQDYEDADT